MSKPWDNEPTPLTKKAIIDSHGQWSFELRDAMANLERRVRAAERLLDHSLQHCKRAFTAQNITAHLEAARKEDGQ